MLKLNSKQLAKIKSFVSSYARPLDVQLMKFILNEAKAEDVLEELQKLQNPDGGFGYGLEPDFRTELSSNMATTIAFQYFTKLQQPVLPKFLEIALQYLVSTYSNEFQRWIPIPEESNGSPHAIWWNYDLEKYKSDSEWGNPTVEIIGYLSQYKNSFNKKELQMLKEKALNRLLNANEIEVHELLCYQRLAKALSEKEQVEVYKKIATLAVKQVERDKSKWNSYVSRPLYFVDDLNSPVYSVLQNEVENELDYIIETLGDEGGWYPNWEWRQYDTEWIKVKPEVAGMVTVKNLFILKTYRRI